jgi:acylphosphatase
MKAVDVVIRGRVQGVGYRWSTERQALVWDIAGWVRNEPNGTVSAHFEGADEAVDAMLQWCWQGPPTARVTDVTSSVVMPTGVDDFQVR